MLQFASAPRYYQHTGLGLMLLSLLLFVLALPPFQAGIWIQTEPLVLGLYSLTAMSALWLAAGVAMRWLVPGAMHPVWLLLAAWQAWQALAGAAAPWPLRSWLGTPELGEGGAWHASVLILTLAAFPLWQLLSCRRALLVTAALSVLLQALLHQLFPLGENNHYIPGSWTPAPWPSYLAFMAGYVALAAIAGGYVRTLKARALLCLYVAIVLFASHNASGRLFLGSAMLATLLLPQLKTLPSRRWTRAALALCVLPLLWYALAALFPAIQPSLAPLERYVVISQWDDSGIGSRIALNEVSLSAIAHEPSRLVTGRGWGSYSDDAFKYALVDGVHIFSNGERKPNFMLIEGSSFHSHSQPMEALLALGLPGLLLWFALPLLLISRLPKELFWACAPLLVGLVALSFMWFELVQCVPFKVLALVALMGVIPPLERMNTWPVRRLVAVLLAAAALMGWSAWQQREGIRYGMQLRAAAHALPFEDYADEWIASDMARGSARLHGSILFHAGWLELKKKVSGLDDNDRGWYAKFMHIVHEQAPLPQTPMRLALLDTWMQYNLLAVLDDPVFNDMKEDVVAAMPDTVLQLARIAPLRDDVAAALLLNLPAITGNDEEKEMAFLHALLDAAPAHRGALWVLGGLLQGHPESREEGDALRKQAVLLGVEKVYPVRDEELAAYK